MLRRASVLTAVGQGQRRTADRRGVNGLARGLANALAAGLALSACANPGADPQSAAGGSASATPAAALAATSAAALAAASATIDPHRAYTEVATATLRQGAFPEITMLQLLGRRDRATGVTTTHARVHIGYQAHSARRYSSARDAHAQPLKLTALSKMFPTCSKTDGCVYGEAYLIDLPAAHARAARQTGYRFKIFSQGTHEKLVAVPASLIASLLDGLDKPPASIARLAPADKK